MLKEAKGVRCKIEVALTHLGIRQRLGAGARPAITSASIRRAMQSPYTIAFAHDPTSSLAELLAAEKAKPIID
jgi:hypothetical protein